MNIYQVLGISPTKDKKVIRKAYAGLIRKYHPEEHPEKWKEIHDAYMVAMQRADEDRPLHEELKPQRKEQKPEREEPKPQCEEPKPQQEEQKPQREEPKPQCEEPKPQQEEQKPQREEQKPQHEEQKSQEKAAGVHRKSESRRVKPKWPEPEEDLFGNLEELTETAKKERQEERQSQLKAAIEQLNTLCEPKKLQFLQWQEFFGKEEYQWAVRQGEFLYELANRLRGHVMGRRLYRFLLDQIQTIENYNRSVNEIPKKQGAYDAYRMVRMELETGYWRAVRIKINRAGVHAWFSRVIKSIICDMKALMPHFRLLLIEFGVVILIMILICIDTSYEVKQTVDRDPVGEYYENIFPDQMTENILKMLDLMNTEQKTELLKMGEPIADGIYVLGNEEQVRLGISAIVMENKTVAEDRERDVPSCEVKVVSDPKGYAFEIQTQEEEKLILYCDPEKLTGCRSVDIYYDGKNGYVKYGNRLQNEEQESERYVHETLGYPVFFVSPGEKICVMPVGDE